MIVSTNIKRPDNWYQGTRIVITDSFYNATTYNPYFSTDYNTNLGQNDLPNDVLYVSIPDSYIKMFINNPSYKIIVYAFAYDGVIDIANEAEKTYYKYSNGAETALFDEGVCMPNNGESLNAHEQKFIEKNIKINNAAYNKYYKFEIPLSGSSDKIDNIELKFTYVYPEFSCDIDKYLNCAKNTSSDTDFITIDNTIIYDGSEKFVITNANLNNSESGSDSESNTRASTNDGDSSSEIVENPNKTEATVNNSILGNDSKSKLDNQISYINYKSKSDSDYSPVLSLEAQTKSYTNYTFLGWYKIHSSEPYTLKEETEVQFSSLFEGFVSSQKVATFDYNKLNELNDDEKYVYFFAVYTSQKNEIIPFENRKMRIMKAY